MQVRKLKQILNTNYIIRNEDDYLAIGSYYCHDLIKVMVNTLEIKRSSLCEGEELNRIINDLYEMEKDGRLAEIIKGKDEIKNPLPVYVFRHDKIIETVTDSYEFPSTDENGYILYTNTAFKTKKECAYYALEDMYYSLRNMSDNLARISDDVNKMRSRVFRQSEMILNFCNENRDCFKEDE